MLIRPEAPADHAATRDLIARAFAGKVYSDGTEPGIPGKLRAAGDLALSLVADADGMIVGYVALSPVKVDGMLGDWYGLGPVAVEPARQRQGIATALVTRAMGHLRTIGASGCAVIGAPDVYGPMGFVSDGMLTYGDLNTRYVQRLTLSGPAPVGELVFSLAFGTD